jgi:hypothetical protein
MPGIAWTSVLLFVLPCIAGMTGTHHCTQPLVETGGWRVLMNFLPALALNHNPSDHCFPSSYDYRLEPPCPARIRKYQAKIKSMRKT